MKWQRALSIVMLALCSACYPAGSLTGPTPTDLPVQADVIQSISATPTDLATTVILSPSPIPSPSSPAATDTALPVSSPSAVPTSMPSPSATTAPTSSPPPSPTATTTPAPSATPTAEPTFDPAAARPGTAQNFELVGHDGLGSVGWHAGLALKGSCAYVGSYGRASMSIVDISDPAHPTALAPFPFLDGTEPVELRTLPDLNLLVVADLGRGRLVTLDITDCAHPEYLGTIYLPGPPHEFFLLRRGSQVLAYAGLFDHGPPDLVIVDLSDATSPREVARWTARDDGVSGILHSLSVSPDGSEAYLAMWRGGFLMAWLDLPHIGPVRDAQGQFSPAQVINAHSAVPLQYPRYVVVAAEVFSCPFAGLSIADITDPAHPEFISRITLPENRCTDLPPSNPVFSPHNPLVVGDRAFVSWYSAGVQAFDLSDPRAPRRLGQFVPSGQGAASRGLLGSYPVQMFSYPIVRDGLFYVADSIGGLYVLRYTGPGADALAQIPLAEGNVISIP
jgi:hypothetical protein